MVRSIFVRSAARSCEVKRMHSNRSGRVRRMATTLETVGGRGKRDELNLCRLVRNANRKADGTNDRRSNLFRSAIIRPIRVQFLLVSELIEPEVEAAIVFLRYVPLIAPMRFQKRWIRHVGRRTHVRFAGTFRPGTAFGRPIVVRVVVERIVPELAHVPIYRPDGGIIANRRRRGNGHSADGNAADDAESAASRGTTAGRGDDSRRNNSAAA